MIKQKTILIIGSIALLMANTLIVIWFLSPVCRDIVSDTPFFTQSNTPEVVGTLCEPASLPTQADIVNGLGFTLVLAGVFLYLMRRQIKKRPFIVMGSIILLMITAFIVFQAIVRLFL